MSAADTDTTDTVTLDRATFENLMSDLVRCKMQITVYERLDQTLKKLQNQILNDRIFELELERMLRSVVEDS